MTDSNLLLDPLPVGWSNHRLGDVCNRVKTTYAGWKDLPKSVMRELNKRQLLILELAIRSGAVTNRQVRDRFKVVRDTAHRDLSILCELGLLQQEGEGRATRYVPQTHGD